MSDAPRPLPWSASCFVCGDENPAGLGVRFTVAEDGEVQMTTVLAGRYEGYPGHVHGGIITALLDETVGWACTVQSGRLCLTVELSVRFRKPVPAGAELRVQGRCEGSSGRFLRGFGRIEDAEGQVLATATGSFAPIPEDRHAAVVPQLKMPGRAARPEDI